METRGIGWAVKRLWDGDRVARDGWNGKHMYLELQKPDANSKMGEPYVYIRQTNDRFRPWSCSGADLLATDWTVAE